MFKFGITLCIAFTFVYAVNARTKALEYTKNRYDSKISSFINGTAEDYNEAIETTNQIFGSILEKLQAYRIGKPAEIIADFQKNQIEADALIDATSSTAIDVVDCLAYISDLDKSAENAADTVKKCVDTQLGAIEGNITKIHESISQALNQLKAYRERANRCHSDNLVASNLIIIRCLRPIKWDLYRLRNPDFTTMIINLQSWLKNFDGTMEACASKSLNIFYGNSSNLIDTVKKCIESKNDLTTTPTTTTNAD